MSDELAHAEPAIEGNHLYYSFALPAISKDISEMIVKVETYLLQVEMNLMELKNDVLLSEFKRSNVFRSLKAFQRTNTVGDAPFSDGPVSLLILFGLRRYLGNHGFDSATLHIVEESGHCISDKFPENHHLIDVLFQSIAGSKSVQKADVYKDKLAQEYLCIDKPVDFAALQSETSASYF